LDGHAFGIAVPAVIRESLNKTANLNELIDLICIFASSRQEAFQTDKT
jgi:hypothetical protein